jgi:hypothetical protein
MNKSHKEWVKRNPWRRAYDGAKGRCKPTKPYGKRGIKFFLTVEEVKLLWFRDKAFLMEQPSIDRINGGGHYVFNNCRFIELEKNRQPQAIAKLSKDGKIIEIYKSYGEAERSFNRGRNPSICDVANQKFERKSAWGFSWVWVKDLSTNLLHQAQQKKWRGYD